ncbi:MAG: hypothetical protein WCI84_01420 [Bacteroidota bacterium]
MPNNNATQLVFADLMKTAKHDAEINILLHMILPLDSRERKEKLDTLLQHPNFLDAPEELKIIFDYFLDDGFAHEVLHYLRGVSSNNAANSPGQEAAPYCKVRDIVDGKVVECLEEKPLCTFSFGFGNNQFCSHPLRAEITKQNK